MGGTFSNHLNSLNVQHKRVIRTLAGLPYLAHTSETFKNLKILKINDLYKYNLCIYMFQHKNHDIFRCNHPYNTRSRENAALNFSRTSLGQRSVFYAGPKYWNDLPASIKQAESLGIFKRKLKSYYLSAY